MSGGFPVIPSRESFGPKPENRYPTGNPSEEMPADLADLLFWTMAGLSQTGTRAWVSVAANGALIAASENWDTNAAGAAPVVERTGPGVYVVTYPATAPDKDGVESTVEFWGAKATPQSLSRFEARQLVRVSRRAIDVLTFSVNRTGTPTAADCAFFLELK